MKKTQNRAQATLEYDEDTDDIEDEECVDCHAKYTDFIQDEYGQSRCVECYSEKVWNDEYGDEEE